ncbi:MAG: phage Gp37/Gp68 family protein [Verrucomicrobia bacterium]|jgi:protein gp37|uniref:Protein gp37 n=1 Tax=Parapedobacter composti TaxID=623281 RepID=A0A1I1MGI1_9SPHI|nr:phage Gp37/Gp68 family protein [Parapedobacter composti]MBS0645518.1 phage Gp37/Gp68 family protein [Verrucomicrobiota bacterium]SFC84467.1 protein gp37 [Parapedobacter composti]
MAQSSIEWTEMTWNPVTGCDKISAGCKFCYAEVMAKRLKAMGVEKYQNEFKLTIHEDELATPYTWKKSKVVFVNSMSDLFHKDVPIEFIQKVFRVMKENPQHVFQVLTKRADVMLYYDKEGWLDWSHNIWMGVSVENEKAMKRIDLLRQSNARTKFLSCEPLIGPLPKLNLKNIDWVIVGGESGRKPRPMKKEWVLDIKQQCEKKDVAFFFKQWGGTNKKKTGNLLDGKKYLEMPEFEQEEL